MYFRGATMSSWERPRYLCGGAALLRAPQTISEGPYCLHERGRTMWEGPHYVHRRDRTISVGPHWVRKKNCHDGRNEKSLEVNVQRLQWALWCQIVVIFLKYISTTVCNHLISLFLLFFSPHIKCTNLSPCEYIQLWCANLKHAR